jgi:hypothetical protein
MTFQVPPRRRQPKRRAPRVLKTSDHVHDFRTSEALDLLASSGVDSVFGLEDIETDGPSIEDLLSYVQAAKPVQQQQGDSALLPSSTASADAGDVSYVASAKGQSNPARSDLAGLAVNTYQLRQDVGGAFGIKPTSIGGRAYRPYKSDHTTGHAIDVPASGAKGDAIAAWVIARASTYSVKYIIFNWQIWYPGRGWKRYSPSSAVTGFASDPGHTRHVHVSTY